MIDINSVGDSDGNKFGDFNVSLAVSQVSREDHWKDRHQIFSDALYSQEIWMDFDETQRKVLVEKIQHSLSIMVDRAEEWVPVALASERGEKLSITLELLFADVNSLVTEELSASSLALEQTVDSIEKRETS